MNEQVTAIAARLPPPGTRNHRYVVAIAGPPAAGKSKLAELLDRHLGGRSARLGLDAFQFDNALLLERGHRARKGAPHTFDVAAYRLMLEALRTRPALEISVPVFDRSSELARNCAAVVGPRHDVIITEGNYLLVDAVPWSDVRRLFDLTMWVDASDADLQARILRRWADHGLTAEEARHRWEQNDGPNASFVRDTSVEADLHVGYRPPADEPDR